MTGCSLKEFFTPAAANWGAKRARAGPEPRGRTEKTSKGTPQVVFDTQFRLSFDANGCGDFTLEAQMGIKPRVPSQIRKSL